MTRLDDAVAAVRAAGDEDGGELADATRRRVLRSLEVRAKVHRQLASAIAIVATLIIGGAVSWALSGVRFPFRSSQATPPAIQPAPEKSADPRTAANAGATVNHVPEAWSPTSAAPPAPPIMPVPPSSPTRPAQPTRPARPRPVRPIGPSPVASPAPVVAQLAPIEVLYRKAHELHFHGSDHVAALAAWDAYLAAEPAGRFTVEAQFNRAVVLVRLARYAEARAALEPFARGQVAPAGYRRDEAEQLLARLARIAGTGDDVVREVNEP